MADYEVRGELILDAQRFDNQIREAQTKLKEFINSFKELNGAGSQLTQLQTKFEALEEELGESRNSVSKLEKELDKLKTSANSTGTSFNNAKTKISSYSSSANAARATNTSLSSSFGLASRSASSFNSTINTTNRLLRTLKTTGSIIFGMYAYQFVDAIGKSATATIKAKSEMESYFRAMKMSVTEQKQFNAMLENTLKIYPKMNKYQLGETLTSLGVEFDLNTKQMEKIGKVAPMIINEYLRAGRNTEEAILAIKDISQGEFLRLSRETGVGKQEIMDAGWSGDLKDIEGLYTALEKVGKSRNWDEIAKKASSLNDVMLITENRFGEFATDLVSRITPSVVNSFNAMIDAMDWLQSSWNSLGTGGQAFTILIGGAVGIGAAVNYLYGVMSNFVTMRAANLMGIDAEIAANEGLAASYAQTTFAEEMKIKADEFNVRSQFEKTAAIQAGVAVQELEAEAITATDVAMSEYVFTSQLMVDELTAKTLALEAEALSMETGMSIQESRIALIEREKVANMGTSKVLATKILGLEKEIVANNGLRVAMANKLRLLDVERIKEIASKVAQEGKTAADFLGVDALIAKRIAAKLAAGAEEEEAAAAVAAEAATLGLAATCAILVAAIVAIALVVKPIIDDFNEMSASFEKVSDTIANGSQRIDELKEKQAAYQKTVDELSAKTSLTTEETEKLNEARRGLTDTTDALSAAEEQYAYAMQVQRTYTNYTTRVEAARYRNLKKLNDELNKQNGTTGKQYIDNTYGMGKAARESYKALQTLTYVENHRNENSNKLTKYQQDYNDTLTDYEIALEKLADPNTSGWDKMYASWDSFWARTRIGWIQFWDGIESDFGGTAWKVLDNSFETYLNIDLDKAAKEWGDWLNGINNGITDLGKAWDDFWQPFTDSLNNLSIDNWEFPNPVEMLTDWIDTTSFDAGVWLDKVLPSADDVRAAIDEHLIKPFQEWLNDPFGTGGDGGEKKIDIGNLLDFDIGGTKSWLEDGWDNIFSGIPDIFNTQGQKWSQMGKNNGQKTVQSTNIGMSGLKGVVSQHMQRGAGAIDQSKSTWGSKSHAAGNAVPTNVKTGVGDLGSIIKSKLDVVTQALDGIRSTWSSLASRAASAISDPLSRISFPFGFGGGLYGYKPIRNMRMPSIKRINTPVYGANDGFESTLRSMLTLQGFRNPNSYEFYPNSQKTVPETWNSGRSNCFDGAELILSLGKLFGLSGHLVTGTYNGMGHAAAVVGGKLYDMTQFQKRGVFRGSSGVSFGSGNGAYYGTRNYNNQREINVHVDLSNSVIYGMDDFDRRVKKSAEETFYKLNDTDDAIGY